MSIRMKDVDSALRAQFMSKDMPYLSYTVGEKRRGIFRIGKWKDEWIENDGNGKAIRKKKTHNVTPNKAMKILYSLRRESWMMETHLWVEPLPEEERDEWIRQFADMNVIVDRRISAS